MQYELTTANREITITLREQLIYSDTTKFSVVLQQVKEANIASCTLDLSGLDHIDSSGLRMLLLLHDCCKESGAPLAINRAHGHVKDMLVHCRFDTIVRMDS